MALGRGLIFLCNIGKPKKELGGDGSRRDLLQHSKQEHTAYTSLSELAQQITDTAGDIEKKVQPLFMRGGVKFNIQPQINSNISYN